MSLQSQQRELVVSALGDYDDFNLLPRSSARHLGLIPRRGGLLLPHTGGPSVTNPALVVLTGWLLATERTIPRYLDLYRAQGCDVLWFPVHPMHIMLPGTGVGLAERVLAITELLLLHGRQLVFHLMSAGAYMFGQMMQAMARRPGGYSRIKECMSGVVFDSPVDTVGIPTAAADILRTRPGQLKWRLIHGILGAYFALTYPLTMGKLRRASNNVKDGGASSNNDWFASVPQLWLYSDDDRVASPEVIEEIVENLQRIGVDVETYKWDSSEHVKHIVEHSEEYARLVLQFMRNKLGMPEPGPVPEPGRDTPGETEAQEGRGGVSASETAAHSSAAATAAEPPPPPSPIIIDAAHARL